MEELPEAENLKVVDFAVISCLFSIKLFDAWLELLIKQTSLVVFGEIFIAEQFKLFVTVVFFCKCAFAIVVALLMDAYNHKYDVTLGGMGSFFLTVAFTLCMGFIQIPILAMITLIMSSLLFVTTPAAFGLIFNHVKKPVRSHARRLVAVMIFVEGLVLFVLQEIVPEKARYIERKSIVACWAMVIAFVVFDLAILEKISKYVSPDNLSEKGLVAVLTGLRDDIRRNPSKTGLSKPYVLVFVFLLIPAFSLTSVETIAANLRQENGYLSQNPWLRRTTSLAKLAAIPLTEVLITCIPVRAAEAEMLVLGLANVLNVAVLALFTLREYMAVSDGVRSTTVSNLKEDFLPTALENIDTSHSISESTKVERSNVHIGDEMSFPYSERIDRLNSDETSLVMIGHQPTNFENVFLIVIINPNGLPLNLEDRPLHSLLESIPTSLGSETLFHSKHVHITGKNMFINLTAIPVNSHSSPFSIAKNFTGKKAYFITLNFSYNRKNDIVVTGEDIEYPVMVQKPMLVVKNTFAFNDSVDVTLVHDHKLQIVKEDGVLVYDGSFTNRIHPMEVPEGKLKLTVRYSGRNPILQEWLKPSQRDIDIEPGSVNVVVISIGEPTATTKYNIFIAEFYRNYGPEKPDSIIQTAFAMIGIILGMSSVGYIHFFWMESPVRLRTTLFAWFLVTNKVVGWIATQIVGVGIGLVEGIILFVFAILTAIWHYTFMRVRHHMVLSRDAEQQRRLSSQRPREKPTD